MNAGALLFLLFAPDTQTLTDEVFEIPAKEWRYVAVTLKQVPVKLDAGFSVLSGSGTVRVAVLNAAQLEEMKQGNREAMRPAKFARQARFQHAVSAPDEYGIVLENGGSQAVSVRLDVSLDFSGPEPRYLSPQRRMTVIAVSATVFLAIVTYSTKKLLRAMRS